MDGPKTFGSAIRGLWPFNFNRSLSSTEAGRSCELPICHAERGITNIHRILGIRFIAKRPGHSIS